MGTTQTTYASVMDVGRPGLMVGCDNDVISGICETAAGLAFGIAVSQGVADKGVIIGGTRAGFLGATIRDVTLENLQLDKYARYQNVGVMTRGKMWVTADQIIAIGDPVHFIAATGKFTNTANQGPINGARWASSCADEGLALIELSGYKRSA